MKTKKFILLLAAVIVVLAIVLVACGAKATATTTAGTGGSGGFAANGTPGARNLTQPLPLAESLLVGTLKLEGTSNAVNATQAAALVPLWQAYCPVDQAAIRLPRLRSMPSFPRSRPPSPRRKSRPLPP